MKQIFAARLADFRIHGGSRMTLPALLLFCLFAFFNPSIHAADLGLVSVWNQDGFAAYEAGQNAKAARMFNKAAQAGDASAKYNLAVMNIRAETRSISRSKSLRWLRQSAHAGFAPAQFMLGELMESGDFTELNKGSRWSALQYFEFAAAQGHADAAHTLALKYLLGRGISPSDERAAYWYTQAARAGDGAAQYTLASFYERGTGVELDLQQALQWYRAAARQGDVAAREKAKFLTGQLFRERKS